MPLSASPSWEAWSELSTRLPADLDLDALARSSKAIQRQRYSDGINDGVTLLRLSLARGPGGMSLQETAAWAHLNGVAAVVAQSLNERLHGASSFLALITHHLLAGRRLQSRLWSGRCLRIADGSSLSQPGSKGTDWRLHAVYDLGQGGFTHLELTDRRGAESLLRCEPVAGEVLIADRGYAKARELRASLDPSGRQARDFIVRIGWRALALRDPQGAPFDLIAHLQTIAPAAEPQEYQVQAVVGRSQQPLRLIVLALPADKAEANRKKLKRKASKHQDRLDPRSLVAAGFVMLVTSLPGEIAAAEIGAVYRLRWQVELAFKRLKSLLHIDRLPTRTRAGSLSWLYAHLILLLLAEDLCQEFLDSPPEDLAGSGRGSLWRCFKLVVDALGQALSGGSLNAIAQADARTHHLLADSKQRRQRQFSPGKFLS
jgi:Transposase DDE domain